MAKAELVKLIGFTLPNKTGQLASVSALLADAGISIFAFRAADQGTNTEFLFSVKSPTKAGKALAPLGVEIREVEALCVEMANKPGRLQKAAERISKAGVNIQSSWATAFSGKTAGCIFMTADNAKALSAMEKKTKEEKPKKGK